MDAGIQIWFLKKLKNYSVHYKPWFFLFLNNFFLFLPKLYSSDHCRPLFSKGKCVEPQKLFCFIINQSRNFTSSAQEINYSKLREWQKIIGPGKIPGKNKKKGRNTGLLSGKYGNGNNKDGI